LIHLLDEITSFYSLGLMSCTYSRLLA